MFSLTRSFGTCGVHKHIGTFFYIFFPENMRRNITQQQQQRLSGWRDSSRIYRYLRKTLSNTGRPNLFFSIMRKCPICVICSVDHTMGSFPLICLIHNHLYVIIHVGGVPHCTRERCTCTRDSDKSIIKLFTHSTLRLSTNSSSSFTLVRLVCPIFCKNYI